jgi:hypothetical protein
MIVLTSNGLTASVVLLPDQRLSRLASARARSLSFRVLSPGAKLATEKADALLKTMRDGLSAKSAEINAVENVILAETKDHADWERLGKVARQTNDSRIRDALKDAVSEVELEEDEHLNWTRDQMSRL